MSQHDYVIANGTGAAVRSDLNNALAAIVSQNSGATAPATTYAYMWWADTTTGLLKIRNAANNAWVTIGSLSTAGFGLLAAGDTLTAALGSASTPGITFTGDLNTGIYSPGADQVAISTNGTQRVTVDTAATTSTLPVVHPLGAVGTPSITFTGDLNTGIWSPAADTIAFSEGGVEAMRIDSSGRVGIGSNAPSSELEVRNGVITAGKVSDVLIGRYSDAFPSSGAGYFKISTNNSSGTSGGMTVSTLVGGSLGEAFRVDDNRRLLVGTSTSTTGASSQYANLQVIGNGSAAADRGAIVNLGHSAASASVTTGEQIGVILFTDNAAGEYGMIGCYADANAGTNDYPGRLTFSTTADSASSPTEAMRINNGQAVLIGRTSSTSGISNSCKLQVATTGADWASHFENQSSTGANCFGLAISYPNASPNNTGNSFFLGIDSTTTRVQLRSNGGLANFQANNVNLSDRNTKKDISPAADTWDCIKEWEIVNYRYKDQPDDADLNLGVIAQQVAESCPEVITVFSEAKDDQPEKLGVKEQQMYWMAIKALQEAQVRIEQLEATNTDLLARVAALEAA